MLVPIINQGNYKTSNVNNAHKAQVFGSDSSSSLPIAINPNLSARVFFLDPPSVKSYTVTTEAGDTLTLTRQDDKIKVFKVIKDVLGDASKLEEVDTSKLIPPLETILGECEFFARKAFLPNYIVKL